ncbi:transposase, partial [Escherichia coli]|uniref:transposase n=1 Tax=Escherichia coli TaxID=562 RepID=UPI0024C12C3E
MHNYKAVINARRKGSANRRKARIQLAAVHERVARAHADFQHKLSCEIVDENQAIIVETLKTANMMKNHHLARAIVDAGSTGSWQYQERTLRRINAENTISV